MAAPFVIDWDKFQGAFYSFLHEVTILSKDEGRVRLEMYDAQRYFFDEVFDGLREDIHWFVCGKGRQVGITTACLLFDVFYAGAVPNVQGSIVFDEDGNKEKFRKLLGDMMETLPPSHRLRLAKGGNNRQGLVFENGNMLDYLTAGRKRGSGSLGRSRAYNFSHATEVSGYGDPEAFEAFRDTLSDVFPMRLYIFESTAAGYNLFYDLWDEAVGDEIAKKAIFVSWWRKRSYSHARGTALYKRYGWPELSKEEQEASAVVANDYDHKISREQWAWYRHRSDPAAQADRDPEATERREIITQEHPHFPEQMFRSTGSPFIPGQYLTPAMARAQKVAFKGYRYHLGDSVVATRIEQTTFLNRVHLRVWQEPVPGGVYIVGGDPAFGLSDEGDGFCAQVCRCYADKVVQVAEFCDRNVTPFQFAWVLLHLCGWYGNCRYIIELNGPGEAVWTELRNLKRMTEDGQLAPPRQSPNDPTPEELERESGIRNTYSLVRQYLYRRADSMGGGGFNYHMKCLSVDTPLPTPDGWTTMGEIKAGDILFDENGSRCGVTEVSDVKTGHDCYRITFDDGSSIVADAEHLWPVADYWSTRTAELRPGVDRIPVANPLQTRDLVFPIHPYALGVWLGDGTSSNGSFTVHKDDAEEMIFHLASVGEQVMPAQNVAATMNTFTHTIVGLKVRLRELGVLDNKHIPQMYLRGSRQQREELLRGLMDTDGSIGVAGDRQCAFTTTCVPLAKGYGELLRSLGIKPKHQAITRELEYNGKIVQCAEAFQFWFTGYPGAPAFKLERKLKRQMDAGNVRFRPKRSKRHIIVAVDLVESVPVRCVMVDSPSHLFLAGDGMIPTHNSSWDAKFTFMTQFADRFMLGEFEINSIPALNEMRTLKKDGRSISAEGRAKDDRPLTLGLITRAYIDSERTALVSNGATYEREQARAAAGGDNLVASYMSSIVANHVQGRRRARERAGRTRGWGW